MLFLFHDRVWDIGDCHTRLANGWRHLGCGRPDKLLARDTLDFAKAVFLDQRDQVLDEELIRDVCALVAVKTQANAVLFVASEPIQDPDTITTRLSSIPEHALEVLRGAEARRSTGSSLQSLWTAAA